MGLTFLLSQTRFYVYNNYRVSINILLICKLTLIDYTGFYFHSNIFCHVIYSWWLSDINGIILTLALTHSLKKKSRKILIWRRHQLKMKWREDSLLQKEFLYFGNGQMPKLVHVYWNTVQTCQKMNPKLKNKCHIDI